MQMGAYTRIGAGASDAGVRTVSARRTAPCIALVRATPRPDAQRAEEARATS